MATINSAGKVEYTSADGALPVVGSDAYKLAQSGVLPSATTPTAPSIGGAAIKATDVQGGTTTPPPPLPKDTSGTSALSVKTAGVADTAATTLKDLASLDTTKDVNDQMKQLLGLQGTKGDFTTKLQTEQDLAGKQAELTKVNNEAITTAKAYQTQEQQLRTSFQGTAEGLNSVLGDLERKKNDDLANIGIRQLVAQNNVTGAQGIIDAKVKAKFEPIDNYIKSLETYQKFYDNDLTEKQKFDLQLKVDDKKAQRSILADVYKSALDIAAKGGAPSSALKAIDDAFASGDTSGMYAAIQPYAKKAANSNMTSDNERALLGQFNNSPIVKDYNVIVAQKLKMDNIIKNGVGGPADLALVYTFMKGLDPNSVVRESEYATAAKSGNIFSGIWSKFNGYFKENGGFLPDTVKTQFANLVNQNLTGQQTQYDNFAKDYRNIATRQGLNPDNVVVNYGNALTGTDADPKADKYAAYRTSVKPGEILVKDNKGNVGAIPVAEFNETIYTKL